MLSPIASPDSSSAAGRRLLAFETMVACLLALVLFTGSAFAQVDTGSLLGNVSDTGGAALPQATVTLADEGTGRTQTQQTAGDGGFSFSPLKVGTYTLTAEKAGFKTSVQKHIEVTVQGHLEINPRLQVGEVAQQVEVTASGPILESQSSSIQQLVDQRTINNLPLNGRNAVFLRTTRARGDDRAE